MVQAKGSFTLLTQGQIAHFKAGDVGGRLNAYWGEGWGDEYPPTGWGEELIRNKTRSYIVSSLVTSGQYGVRYTEYGANQSGTGKIGFARQAHAPGVGQPEVM